ncbi:RDD family protein [Calidifontibacter sp. DB0510]|uniref:RDD family protein n=1 Tax=Metallococcus carri TaxID=1656884 RepID=A0A967B0U2_9MICO|nr:RDD family protein [Metallococcus carri]NHN55987.1 RDD family protein [Metallococcus carri]NOP37556.1 RDD family protein [Calidifontibacter sp. DB2511S]
MVDRKDVGSWLEGPTQPADPAYLPGSDLGLPAEGPGSVARIAPRLGAIFVDWTLCSLIAAALLGYRWGAQGSAGFMPLLVFMVENVLLVGTLGSTIGHRLFGMRVVGVDGGPAKPLQALIRTVLLALVIPAVIWDKDQRGFHDKAAGTVLLRTSPKRH